MESITSTRNERIRFCQSLHQKKGREETGCFLVEGLRLCAECLKTAPNSVRFLLYGERLIGNGFITQAEEKGIPAFYTSEAALKKASDSKENQGILLVCSIPPKEMLLSSEWNMLALDGIADPGNLGTILRTAWAFGVQEILLGNGCADVYAPKVVRSGMGAHFSLRLYEAEDLPRELLRLHEARYIILGGDSHGKEVPQESVLGKCCIVIGSEAKGLSTEVRNACTGLVCIPMAGGVESLNAAVSTGILLDRLLNRSNAGV